MSSRRRGPLLVLATGLGALALGSMPATGAFAAQAPAAQSADDARAAALRHVRENAADFGVTGADVASLTVTSNYVTRHSGVGHVNINQQYNGLEVFGGHATVNVASDGRIAFAGGSLVRGLDASAAGAVDLSATSAVKAAADRLELDAPVDLRVLSRGAGAARRTVVSGGGISREPIPARLGYHPGKDGLRLAWQLTIDDTSSDHLWNATVDAETGALLKKDDWTTHESAEDVASGLEGLAATSASFALAPVQIDDGSSYRVFNFAKESPNDGPRALVNSPADGNASPFGWHDTNGAAGAEFTITRGNNVHAYLDQDDSETPDFGVDVDGGPGLDFDFPADLTEHAQFYRDAVVANLFYSNNALHDVLYQYGFDEPSGNFQANNYGRGGGGGDYVRAEAADGSGTNNANFSTPAADAGTPRMQMFLWPGNQFGFQNEVTVAGGATYGARWARFGPPATNAGVSGQYVAAGTGCKKNDYPRTPPAGWIAVVDGGTAACSYVQRAELAAAAGARALVVAHNTADAPPILGGSFTGPPVTIPAASISQADGAALKQAIAAGSATGVVRKNPAHPGIRDGDFENGIIIHEYGHGVSNRLTGGPGINCLSGNEQGGEGWSDYLAITVLMNPALEGPDGPRGMGPYALFQANRQGNGIRPRPYSRNMAIQPFTYDSIKTGGWLNGTSLALPHGLGHGWAAVLWDMNWDLIDKHGFNPNVYESWDTGGNNRALQYVIDGLKLQGCGPGLVVASRAIIAAADELTQGGDTCTLWATFARRGLGFSAVQGTTDRNDNSEAFDTHPNCRRDFLAPIAAEPALNTVGAGSTRPLHFTADGYTGLDVLASGSPYSRQVDCTTLATITPGQQFITPRPIPVPAQTNGKLTVDADGVFNFPWQTSSAWSGTCRELVMTRKDGRQHRAYFRFV
jgi:extracellular elastinolytic metalloproteinase